MPGSEALKSLVLAGLERFTIVDPNLVTRGDLGKNFFVTKDDLGKPRAEVVAQLLQRHGLFMKKENAVGVHKDPVELLNENPEFYKQFDLLIVSGCTTDVSIKFSHFCKMNHIELVIVRAYSQIGLLQLYSKEHDIFDCRNKEMLTNYHILNPWKELEDYCTSLLPENVYFVLFIYFFLIYFFF